METEQQLDFKQRKPTTGNYSKHSSCHAFHKNMEQLTFTSKAAKVKEGRRVIWPLRDVSVMVRAEELRKVPSPVTVCCLGADGPKL